MKRENISPNHAYFSPPPPNIPMNSYIARASHRESMPIQQFLPQRQHQFQPRYSNNVQSNHPNNAFAHLRNQISNLRSQFTKLIQKDTVAFPEKGKEDKLNLTNYKKQQRTTSHSTIGFTNHNHKQQAKNEQKSEYYFKNKLSLLDQKSVLENNQESKRQQNLINVNKYHKKYSFQPQEKRQEYIKFTPPDYNKIHQLEQEIRRIGEIKSKLEEENIHLKMEIHRIEKQSHQKIQEFLVENQRLRNNLEQAHISVSLKSSLVQKMQIDHLNLRRMLQADNKRLEAELQDSKIQINQINTLKKHEMDKIYNRHDQQIKSLQGIHEKNISDILDRLKKSQQSQRNLQLSFIHKEEECDNLKRQNYKYEEKHHQQVSIIETFQNNLRDLQAKHEQINLEYQCIHKKYQQSLTKPDEANEMLRIKAIEDENIDLQKRVESYKKTVQQLNSSNNSSRQKLLVAREESKKAREEAKFLSEQLQVKQKLISSLYRDINILDAQIRNNVNLKFILSSNVKFNEQLTHRIVELECQKLNRKYNRGQQQRQSY